MTRKILTAVLSFVVAFGLWLYVVTVVSPEYQETFRDIPVNFVGENVLENDRKLMRLDKKDYFVTLQLSGNRADIAKLSASNITVTVDLSRVDAAGTPTLSFDVGYPGNVPKEAITVLNREPSGIQLEIVNRKNRVIPVEVAFVNQLPENYIKEKPELLQNGIVVSGPENEVDKIAAARVEVDLAGVTENVSGYFPYTLVDSQGEPVDTHRLTLDPDPQSNPIGLTVQVKKVKQLQLQLDVLYGAGTTKENTVITLDHDYVLVSGSDSLLEGMDAIVLGQIDLTKIHEDQQILFSFELPEGITNESGYSEVKVTVDLPELQTKTVRVTNITALNVPDGMTATVAAQEMDVRVRGVPGQLDTMTEADLTLSVDLTGCLLGTDRYEVHVIVSSRFPNAGPLGEYTVLVSLSETVEE